MSKKERSARARSFIFRGGARVAGTVVVCDEPSGGDLSFLSSARAWLGRSARHRRGRRPSQILTTSETLCLMGSKGDRLRARALLVGMGRPFVLGSVRLELLPSGHLPGAAALLADTGAKRVLYAGAARLGAAARGAEPGVVRAADALCIDATFGDPRFVFISREEAEATARQFARDARDAGCAPVFLATAYGPAQDLASALAADGWKLRGHRTTASVAAAYRRVGLDTPAIGPFAGTLARDEALLWPADERGVGRLGGLGPARVAWVSGFAADPAAATRFSVDLAIPYSCHADFAGLLAYVAASGAREVAIRNGFADGFAAALRARDVDAYTLGPPRQIALFPEPD